MATVAINDLIALVNIALGATQASMCPNGLPLGGDVNVAVIIQTVNNARAGGCVARCIDCGPGSG